MNRLEKSSFPSWKQLFNYKASYNSTNPKTRTWDILLNEKRHKTKYTVRTKIWFNDYTYVCVCVCLRVTYTLVSSVQSLSRVRLCNIMDCSTPSLPVHHQLLELTQTHVHWVSDAIQPSQNNYKITSPNVDTGYLCLWIIGDFFSYLYSFVFSLQCIVWFPFIKAIFQLPHLHSHSHHHQCHFRVQKECLINIFWV